MYCNSVNKGALIALLFFLFNTAIYANNKANYFYKLGYDYSLQGRNNDAFRWMLAAANVGHIAAQNNIGLSYLHGLGVEKNKKLAFYWFEKAAKQDLSYAQSELAMLYYQNGNLEKAREYWLKAAKKNDEYAQFNLASLFLEKKNIEKSIYWFKQAQKNNHPKALNALEQLQKIK